MAHPLTPNLWELTDRQVFDRIFAPWSKALDINSLWVSARIENLLKESGVIWSSHDPLHTIESEKLEESIIQLTTIISNILQECITKFLWNAFQWPAIRINDSKTCYSFKDRTIYINSGDLEKYWRNYFVLFWMIIHEFWHHILFTFAKNNWYEAPSSERQEEFCDYLVGYVLRNIHDNWWKMEENDFDLAIQLFSQIWQESELSNIIVNSILDANSLKQWWVSRNNVHGTWLQRIRRFIDGYELWDFWFQLKLLQPFSRKTHLS